MARALGALAAVLFVLSAGTTTISSLGDDPAALAHAYSPDGYSVVEVRRPSAGTVRLVAGRDLLTGTDTSTDPNVRGSLTGSCAAVRHIIGGYLPCDHRQLYGTAYEQASPPTVRDAAPTPLRGPAATFSTVFCSPSPTEPPSPRSTTTSTTFRCLPSRRADCTTSSSARIRPPHRSP
ncbi:hypothetical protein [Frankia sp. AgKG'84/4]|uniref:hypothetical protein n=1 Tax=Frankia sp. AgKG'84/4 TaxID=573490 RepID=UPI00200F8354|nr:hypothetical protein [Frankia sp. AgKG'84/4]MCL9793184.1 hypothetical protein [Frankia sp. AgKG'84/4]